MIIVGLGNPGQEYETTRHNVGFSVLDEVLGTFPGSTWKKEFGVAWCTIGQHLLIKPQEHMNVSGQTVVTFLQKKNIAVQPENILVIHDDLDFPLGEVHEQANRSAGGHNGVQSLIDALGSQNFSRIRLGIGSNREFNIPAEAYVLQKFSKLEEQTIRPAITAVALLIQAKLGL